MTKAHLASTIKALAAATLLAPVPALGAGAGEEWNIVTAVGTAGLLILALIAVAALFIWAAFISYAFATLALFGVFVYIPYVSDYAFWVFTLAYIMLIFNYLLLCGRYFISHPVQIIGWIFSLVVAFIAVNAVFVYIPFITNYAFWFLVLSYLILGSLHLAAWTQRRPAPVRAGPPPPPPHLLDRLWYLQVEAEVQGPYTGRALKQMIETGGIGTTSFVAEVGATAWTSLADSLFAPYLPPAP
jgi:hypothetical protein